MDSESRAGGSHYLLLLGTRKLSEYRLCYGRRGLDRKRVHEHARCRRHFVDLSQPEGNDLCSNFTPSLILFCSLRLLCAGCLLRFVAKGTCMYFENSLA